MKISVITVTRNNQSTIDATIASVMSQTYHNIEYIIIDGASTDNSTNIIKSWQQKHPDKIHFISEPDKGIYNAINKGITMAKGNIIGLLHGNDFFSSPLILEQIASTMAQNSVHYVYGDVCYVKHLGGEIIRYYSSAQFKPEMLNCGIAPPHPSLYVRREVFEQYGNYKEDYLIGADFDFFIRLILVNNLRGLYIPLNMVTMTLGGLSTQLYHQIFTNNREKYRALKENNIKASRFLLIKRYLYILKHLKV